MFVQNGITIFCSVQSRLTFHCLLSSDNISIKSGQHSLIFTCITGLADSYHMINKTNVFISNDLAIISALEKYVSFCEKCLHGRAWESTVQ